MERNVAVRTTSSALLGFAIANQRRALGMGQTELGQAAKVSQGFLSKVELGNSSPSDKTLDALAKALGTTPEALKKEAERYRKRLPGSVEVLEGCVPCKEDASGEENPRGAVFHTYLSQNDLRKLIPTLPAS